MEASAGPRFSVVIPAYNEERLLPGLLDSIDAAREIHGGGPGAIEVIVADNASTDSTASLAASRGCLVVPVEKRVIAAARNGGARAARGEIVCFVDADARIHRETFRAIDEALAPGRVVGGATGVRLRALVCRDRRCLLDDRASGLGHRNRHRSRLLPERRLRGGRRL